MSDNKDKTTSPYEFKKIESPFVSFQEVGQVVEGTVLGDCSYVSDGDNVPCILLLSSNGKRVKLNLGAAQLKEFYAIESPSKGDFIAIRYDGEHPKIVKKGNHMQMYSYHIEKNSNAF